ncbi:ATP-dependent protease ATPase subunit HslU [Stratiformator vulcanicus]|uniref:ATP-dependent protease ATPase subunit HslU n=1 Tax=Stratiformator vulcanicus TaxID=2527980 RepID=A0A517QXP1_9PLAN|nr:ATP-dependent protease ATPase subunit HslU [Stratiformator vulcanicus]QDT36422.1 ATP-dependent protease ATPase subunit HslU [Stratiformator vulcanicus]
MPQDLISESDLTPRQIVAELDRHIVGQQDAKRSVAIALRNRRRWAKLPAEMRREIGPKNILMIGPTGVGKTEITRRLARIIGAPFVKVEATKYTEVGYYGRDVESMIRDLVDAAVNLVVRSKRVEVEDEARLRAEDRLLDLLLPGMEPRPLSASDDDVEQEPTSSDDVPPKHRTREKFREMLRNGELDQRKVEISIRQKGSPVQVLSNAGMDQMELQNLFEQLMPKKSKRREVEVKNAKEILFEEELDALTDTDAVHEEAVKLAESSGIVFVDEIDKVATGSDGGRSGSDVSRQGVQRDLLPIVEGTTVQTRYGSLKTDDILFIAAGAFHQSKPADLMPELQGRFPIRVELADLTRDDFLRILTVPRNSLTRQYAALLEIDGVELEFTDDGLEELASIAHRVNQSTQNIGARRLHTVMERLLEQVSFDAPEEAGATKVDVDYVRQRLAPVLEDEDLTKFIL